MRDILVTLIVFGSLPFIFQRPYIGILVWSWLGYMNPHRLSWGFAYSMPFAQIVAIVLMASLLMSKEKKELPVTALTVTWWLFIGWMVITSLSAIYFDDATTQLIKILKIQLVVFLGLLVMGKRERIYQLIWVIYLSIGFFGIKGGVFTILTGGSHRVLGPPDSFIGENNALAVALLMILPLGMYLYWQTRQVWIRRGLIASNVLIAVSAVGSQSRGAFLAIIAVAAFFWWKSKNRLAIALVILPLLPILFFSMPQSWHDRMSTIQTYEKDASAMGRLNAWQYAINAANARLTGAGLESWSIQTFQQWAPDPTDVHAAHSIYFSVLADHGWIGLFLFLLILLGAWRTASHLIRETRGSPDYLWMNELARMIQVSMIAYMTGGAFLSLSYFDLPWHVISILVLMKHIHTKEVRMAAPQPSEATGEPESAAPGYRLR